mmetsp:Transcript_35530/g.57498  ORF Transcript_35530/g.57498 Transcript_35530/m.57498 type:complete len:497 (-) Transcript_35530:580-2070(-)
MDVRVVRPPLRGQLPGKGVHYDPVVYGNEMYVFCPDRELGVSSEGVSAFNLDALTWRNVQTIGTGPCARCWHATALLNDQMFIIGGIDNSRNYLGDAWSLDLKSLQWKAVIADNSDESRGEPGPSGSGLYAIRTKGDIYILCIETCSLWRLGPSGNWTRIWRDEDFAIRWFTGNDEMMFVVAESGTFSWDWESSCWTQLNEQEWPENDDNNFFSSQQSSLVFWHSEGKTLKVLGMEKQWITVFDSHSVPFCISEETIRWYSMCSYKGIVVLVGCDEEKKENAVWLLSIPYHPSSDIHTPGSDFLTLVDSPYTDFKLVPKEGIEQAVPVIKSVLAVCWQWFAILLQSGMQEVSEGIVHVPKSRNVVVALVKYLYGGCLPPSLPVKTLVGLSKLADMYQLTELAELSSLALRGALSNENCIKIFRCGLKTHDGVLRWFAVDYILERFSKICLTQEYASLIVDTHANQAFSTHMPPDMNLSWSTHTLEKNKRKQKRVAE